jgi:uncharacterized coiled-coil protein SlyX
MIYVALLVVCACSIINLWILTTRFRQSEARVAKQSKTIGELLATIEHQRQTIEADWQAIKRL